MWKPRGLVQAHASVARLHHAQEVGARSDLLNAALGRVGTAYGRLGCRHSDSDGRVREVRGGTSCPWQGLMPTAELPRTRSEKRNAVIRKQVRGSGSVAGKNIFGTDLKCREVPRSADLPYEPLSN